MEIFIQASTSYTNLSVSLHATCSVAALKEKIFATRRQIYVEHQRLSFGNCVLEDERSLADYNISEQSTVVLRYGPKFPFSFRPPSIPPAEDFNHPADVTTKHPAGVSTVLGGSQSVNENPFAPIRLFVSNAQVCHQPE